MRNKIFNTFFLDLSYFLLFVLAIIFAREKIQQFLLNLQSYAPQLNTINANENLAGAQNLISQINSLSTTAFLFTFILIPLIIFIIYILLQGYSLYLLKKEKKYFLKFILASFPSFVFFSLLLFNSNIYLLIITILSFYFSFFFYFKNLKKFELAFKKIYKFFPLFLLYLVLSLITIGIFFFTYLNIIAGNKYVLLFLLGLIFTLIFSYYKIKLVEKSFN